ncbi:MAG: hypothetical protein DRG25_03365, partial [Deltaproteobacteria bacterium]
MLKALCFHAEKLHDDRVWKRLKRTLKLMRWRGLRATFFIYPFRAVVKSKKISGRVKFLLEEGHEIGQHTHFYAGTAINKPNKHSDLSDENIRACIRRDYEWLNACGVKPRGFCAGSWIINDVVFETLVDLGFEYDCSSRIPILQQMENTNRNLWLSKPEVCHINMRNLILLPTTHSLGDLFRFNRMRDSVVIKQKRAVYQLIYLHDYDLLRINLYLGLLFQILINHFLVVREISKQIR